MKSEGKPKLRSRSGAAWFMWTCGVSAAVAVTLIYFRHALADQDIVIALILAVAVLAMSGFMSRYLSTSPMMKEVERRLYGRGDDP